MKNLKRNSVIVVVLLFVCVAVYLNWSYNSKWGTADLDMVMAENEAMAAAEAEYENVLSIGNDDSSLSASVNDAVSEYFASARLTRQQSRDEALNLLQTAASTESASQEVIDRAMDEISVMATWSLQEAQMENLLMAKDFSECVVFMSDDEITVAVPAPIEGLSEASVARITDIITSETNIPATQIRIIEVKSGAAEEMADFSNLAETSDILESTDVSINDDTESIDS